VRLSDKVALTAIIVVLLTAMWTQHARADIVLSNGTMVTCDQVRFYAGEFQIPDTRWGRARARIIGAALGLGYLTDAQLSAAARCIREKGG